MSTNASKPPFYLRSNVIITAGLILSLIGVLGFFFSRKKQELSLNPVECALLNCEANQFRLSFVLAGRDIKYTKAAQEPIYNSRGVLVGHRVPAEGNAYGTNTDTIIFVQIIDNKIYMVMIPRDIYLPSWQAKINSMYFHKGADGLADAVSELIGLPVNHYMIINMDVFKHVVDALDGVDVNVPYRMQYTDDAAQLTIDLQPGEQHLDGEQAANFIRFRQTALGDLDRVDNVKTLANAMLARLKELNVRAIGAVPELISTYMTDVETDLNPQLMLRLATNLSNAELHSSTLPTIFNEGSSILSYSKSDISKALASIFGGTNSGVSEVPKGKILISNRSGVAKLEQWLADRLIAQGFDPEQFIVRNAAPDPTPSHVQSNLNHIEDAAYVANLLQLTQQQVARVDSPNDTKVDVEIVLGRDAERFYAAQAFIRASKALVIE